MSNKKPTNNSLTLDNIFSCLDVLSRANALASTKDKKLSEDIAQVIYTIMVACQLEEKPVTGYQEKKKTEDKYYYAGTEKEITDLVTGQVIYRS